MQLLEPTYDVAVFGGGLQGFAVARAAARAGLSTLLVERRQVLGWETVWALGLDWAKVPASDAGLALDATLRRVGGVKDGRLDNAIVEQALDRELSDSGAKLLYYAQPVALARDAQGIAAVLIGSKSGQLAVKAKSFVDATDNAILWRLAGGEVTPLTPPGLLTAFLQGVTGTLTAGELGPLGTATAVRLAPGCWAGEWAAEFTLPHADAHEARCALPDLLLALRARLPELGEALVSHVSVEPLPLGPQVAVANPGQALPGAPNLLAAGLWAVPGTCAGCPQALLAAGERLGAAQAPHWRAQPARRGPMPPLQVVVAPPVTETEVLVAGGGTGGAIAALAAARAGSRTTLIEASPFLGGIGAGGGIHVYYLGIQGGLQDEVDERVKQVAPAFGPLAKCNGFNPEAKKSVLHQMAKEAGVTLILNTTATGVETEDQPQTLPARQGASQRATRSLRGVVIASPAGAATIRAGNTIDATGDGDVAAMAGAPCTFGRETDGLTHAYSLAGSRWEPRGYLRVVNFDAGYCDPTDIADLTRARRFALTHYWQESFDAVSRMCYLAPLIGLRNSRQVVGDYRLTFQDEIQGKQFDDVIAFARSHYDNHASDYENESDEAMVWVWLLGHWRTTIGSEIPYRCLLPQGVDNLLLACRALSLTHDAHNQMRMQRDIQRIGEAAGYAAAQAVRDGVTPRQVALPKIQERLLATGALGQRSADALPAAGTPAPAPTTGASLAERLHHPTAIPVCLPAPSLEDGLARLAGEHPRSGVWQLTQCGPEVVPALLDELAKATGERRLLLSLALAWHGRAEAAPALREAVKERRADKLGNMVKESPIWQVALILLGRTGDRQAVPEVAAVLADPTASLDALIGAMRVLGKLGDPRGVSAIEAMLQRTDLPTQRVLQRSGGANRPVVEEARWQLELAAADVLARLGTARADIVVRYMRDERAYVRRYANQVERSLPKSVGY